MNIEIVHATYEHALGLAPKLRTEDENEVMASGGFTSLEALLASVYHSDTRTCWTALLDGEPEIMWGAAPFKDAPSGNHGIVWLLSSYRMYEIPGRFLKESAEYVSIMLTHFDSLHNHVDVMNIKSQQWLDALGFLACSRDEKYGVAQTPFILYCKANPSCANP